MEDHREAGNLIPFLEDDGLKLVLFGGKGGVGKTTSATSSSLYLAGKYPSLSFLFVSTDPAHSISHSLRGGDLFDNLEVVELDSKECLNSFKRVHQEKFKEIARRGTFLDDEDIEGFLELSLPGMDELMGFLEIAKWVGDGDYDRVIVDTAPSGHTLRLLEMPDLLSRWLKALDALLAKHRYMKKTFSGGYRADDLDLFIMDLSERVSSMEHLLRDKKRCRFVPVMIPEALSVNETLMLLENLGRSEIPVTDLIVNRLLPVSDCALCSRQRQLQTERVLSLPDPLSSLRLWGAHLHGAEVMGGDLLEKFFSGLFRLKSEKHLVKDIKRLSMQLASPIAEYPAQEPGSATRFLMFSGKGGVGKTTLASAAAMELAKRSPGKEILLFSTDPAHSLAGCLNMDVGSSPRRIAPGVSALEIDAGAEFDSLKKLYAHELEIFLGAISPNFDLTFDREVMEKIMDLSPPGLDEVMALTSFVTMLMEEQYDLFILDTAPTGHLIRLLELPELIEQWIRLFFGLFLKYREMFRLPEVSRKMIRISKEVKYLRKLLRDGERASLYAVSIPTEMAFEETRDLVSAAKRLGVPVPVLFLNQISPPGGCSLCNWEREEQVRERFSSTFAPAHQVVVYRNLQPMGKENLTELGAAIFKS